MGRILLLTVYLCALFIQPVRANEVVILVDTSDSMSFSAANVKNTTSIRKFEQSLTALIGLFEEWPSDEVSPRVILWNTGQFELPYYTPEELAHYFRTTPPELGRNTLIGNALFQAADMACVQYIILTDFKPIDRVLFKAEVAELLRVATVSVFILESHLSEESINWYRTVSTEPKYRVAHFQQHQEATQLRQAVSRWYEAVCKPSM
jgi:hypothetical protein